MVGEKLEDIARPATRPEYWGRNAFGEFPSKPVYINFDKVREWVKTFVPDMLRYLFAADDPIDIPGEIVEQRVFLIREQDLLLTGQRFSAS